MRPLLFAVLFVAGGVIMEKLGIEYKAAYALFGYALGALHACAIFGGE